MVSGSSGTIAGGLVRAEVRARAFEDRGCPFHSNAACRKRGTIGLLAALGAVAALAVPATVRAQFVSAYEVKPTVTSSQGDLGGKYFGKAPDPSKTHHYYVAAEPDQW